MQEKPLAQIDNLTGLRAFAALSVMLLHIRYAEAADRYGAFAFLFQNQGLGVYVFFVLSGFILAYVHAKDFVESLSWREAGRFLWARLSRIYPVHLFTLALVALALPALGLWTLRPADTLQMLLANLFLVHSWNVTENYTFNDVSWTISAEWMAYLLFPAIAFGTRRWPPLALAALIVVCVIALERLRLNGLTFGAGCVFYFTIGFACYRLIERLPDAGRRFWALGAYASTASLIAVLWVRPQFDFYPFVFFAFTASTAALIVCLFKAGPVALYANPVSVYLGRVSYSLYMSHMITTTVLRDFMGIQPLWLEIPVIIGMAALTYHLIEEPARRSMRSLRAPSRLGGSYNARP